MGFVGVLFVVIPITWNDVYLVWETLGVGWGLEREKALSGRCVVEYWGC